MANRQPSNGISLKHLLEDDGHGQPEGNDDEHQEGSNREHEHEPTRKRQRIRLSCLECRRRKLSCSRELPCDRCLKSGTPDRCTYESRPGGPITSVTPSGERTSFPLNPPLGPYVVRRDGDGPFSKDAAREHERVRKLELEVARLRSALSKQISVDGSTVTASPAVSKDANKDIPTDRPGSAAVADRTSEYDINVIRGNCFRTRFYGPHNAWSSLRDLTGITTFMKETAEQWLTPLNISKKDRPKRRADRRKKFAEPDAFLESLLPPENETDSLVKFYLDQFEPLHRIVHIPTFIKEYEGFWDSTKTRSASLTALVLSIISVSCCLDTEVTGKFVGIKSSLFQTAEKWVTACEDWLSRQSQKHRHLVHYQIACMLFLAKRVNVIKKKRYWTGAGAMIREAVAIGMHLDPDHVMSDSDSKPYLCEMRRRLWANMIEFDVQASFDQGLPTLMSQINNDTNAPRNIDDDDFDESSEQLPVSQPRTRYTMSSYAHISRQSLSLRLDLNKLLAGPPIDLEWEQALQYSDMIMQEIDALPSWDLDTKDDEEVSPKPLLAHTLLHIQLRQYLIPLYQPYLRLRKYHSKYQTAHFLYYSTARDLILMHDRLFQKGIRTLYFLREDAMHAALNLCSVTFQQPKGSTSIILSNAQETLHLVEKTIALKEDRILRCGNNEPWIYSSICAAYGLLETHLGVKTMEAAKASAAERFIGLHYKLLAYQASPFPIHPTPPNTATPPSNRDTTNDPPTVGPFSGASPAMPIGNTSYQPEGTTRDGMAATLPWLLPQADASQLLVPNPDINFGMLGSDLNELWGDFGGLDFS
ncbi:fungal-specific transcription factor domain-containing protein [Xylariomycetidae sp. FL0641]|nr:fungal-specific transcription factor domain-containing protein [Xylariomycetidae sp. FL0641]